MKLNQKFNLIVFSVFLLLACVTIAVQLPMQKAQKEIAVDNVVQLLDIIISSEEAHLANEIFENRTRATSLRLSRILGIKGVRNVILYDSNGAMIDFALKSDTGNAEVKTPESYRDSDVYIQEVKYDDQSSLHYQRVIKFENEILGSIEIFYSIDDIKRQNNKSVLMVVTSVLATLIVVFIMMNFALQNTVVIPVQNLISAVKKYNPENPEEILETDKRDELGDLTRNFNSMAAEIYDYSSELNEKNHELARNRRSLLHEKKLLSGTLGSLKEGVLTADSSGMVIMMNRAAEEISGWSEKEASGIHYSEILKVSCLIRKEQIDYRDVVLYDRSGFAHFIDLAVEYLYDDEGFLFSIAISFNDITDKVEAEYEMTRMRLYLLEILDSMPLVLVSLDMDNRVDEWNRRAETVTGLPKKDVLGMDFRKVIPGGDFYLPYIENVRDEGRLSFINHTRLEFMNREGYFNVTIFPVESKGRNNIIILLEDVTELEKKNAQLLHSQKMDMFGTLAGGLAHDFNNILGGIVGSVALLKLLQEEGDLSEDKLTGNLATIEKSASKATRIVENLMNISKSNSSEQSAVDLHVVIRNVVEICRNTFDKSLEIIDSSGEGSFTIEGDSGQIEQVLLNLCINSSHAMTTMRGPDENWGGVLTVSVEEQFTENSRYCRISVADTGVGIRQENIPRIFDPFYTTKTETGGTGLGLAMAASIVAQHNGFIDVKSALGEGSAFHLYFPVYRGGVFTEEEKPEENRIMQKESRRILLVDDEELLRNVSRDLLQECGYNVLSASHGEEAIRLYREYRGEIDLVMLDIAMPGASGDEVFRRLKAEYPDIRVLVISGNDADRRVRDVLSRKGTGFLKKPYTLAVLSEKINELINS